ncbi:MAG: hypothetical protein AAFQ17_06325, partial [Pseudomonadota bacterium]
MIETRVRATIEALGSASKPAIILAASIPDGESNVRGYHVIIDDQADNRYEFQKRPGDGTAGTLISSRSFSGGMAAQTVDNKWQFRLLENAAGTEVTISIDSFDGTNYVEEHSTTDSSSPYTQGGVGLSTIASGAGAIDYSAIEVDYRLVPQIVSATVSETELVLVFSEAVQSTNGYVNKLLIMPEVGVDYIAAPELVAGDGTTTWSLSLAFPINQGDVIRLGTISAVSIEALDGVSLTSYLGSATPFAAVANASTRTGPQLTIAAVINALTFISIQFIEDVDSVSGTFDVADFSGTVGGEALAIATATETGGALQVTASSPTLFTNPPLAYKSGVLSYDGT